MNDMGPYFNELHKDAQEIVTRVEEAYRHWQAGNHGGAALVLGLMHYPIDQVADEVSGLLGQYREQGITPDDGVKGRPLG